MSTSLVHPSLNYIKAVWMKTLTVPADSSHRVIFHPPPESSVSYHFHPPTHFLLCLSYQSTIIIIMWSFLRLLVLATTAVTVAAGTNQGGLDFLAANADKAGVVVLPSGLQYKILTKGAGTEHPTVDSPCSCHYAGTLIDGTTFDSSYERGSPTTFAPNQVIRGVSCRLRRRILLCCAQVRTNRRLFGGGKPRMRSRAWDMILDASALGFAKLF
jgi:hypothetical protein